MSPSDTYIHGMDWLAADELKAFELTNYRTYQFDLIKKHIGRNILEVGSGDRSFTNLILKNVGKINRFVSIEPSKAMMKLYKYKYRFPDTVEFVNIDLFDMTLDSYGLFDTIILVHVLEHIKEDREALTHLHSLLAPYGKVLIEVPAMPFLFSVHDKMLGHFRRYDKDSFYAAVDTKLYTIHDLWFQDAIGMMGSLFFFKFKGVKLKSKEGVGLVKKQGGIYDQYIIPFEKLYERFLRLPFGLTLTGILEKKQGRAYDR